MQISGFAFYVCSGTLASCTNSTVMQYKETLLYGKGGSDFNKLQIRNETFVRSK